MSARAPYKIAVIPGDGIGKEVMPEGLRVLELAAELYNLELQLTHFDFASCDYYFGCDEGSNEPRLKMMPDDWVEQLKPFDCILFGAVGDPKRVPDHISLWGSLLLFRRKFDQYINLRPTKLIKGVPCPLANPKNIDFLIVRENTEGEYSEIGGRMFHGTDRELVTQNTVMTRQGVDRVLKYAFELARTRERKHVTSATKSNGICHTMPYWDERFEAMAAQYPDVTTDKFHIDILTAHFVQRPSTFDVVVGSNLFGDILSDLGPAITGTIGIAPSANIKPDGEWPSLFEPVHGSAPDIAGMGIANPVGMIWSVSLMLQHLGECEASAAVLKSIENVLGRGDPKEVTRDMGGQATTEQLGTAIVAEFKSVAKAS